MLYCCVFVKLMCILSFVVGALETGCKQGTITLTGWASILVLRYVCADCEARRMGREDQTRFDTCLNAISFSRPNSTSLTANQFRALEEDEIMFLDSVREKQEEDERIRRLKDSDEVMDFKK